MNLSGNARDGLAFNIEFSGGARTHRYVGEKPQTVAVPTKASPSAPRTEPMPKGETWAAVKGADEYADITSGPRNGHYVNLSGNERHGREFLIVRRDGDTFHVYGSGDDKESVRVESKPDST